MCLIRLVSISFLSFCHAINYIFTILSLFILPVRSEAEEAPESHVLLLRVVFVMHAALPYDGFSVEQFQV